MTFWDFCDKYPMVCGILLVVALLAVERLTSAMDRRKEEK